jgi:hypothetical protein
MIYGKEQWMTGCIDGYRYNVTNRSMYVTYGWMDAWVFGCEKTQEWPEVKVHIWGKRKSVRIRDFLEE